MNELCFLCWKGAGGKFEKNMGRRGQLAPTAAPNDFLRRPRKGNWMCAGVEVWNGHKNEGQRPEIYLRTKMRKDRLLVFDTFGHQKGAAASDVERLRGPRHWQISDEAKIVCNVVVAFPSFLD